MLTGPGDSMLTSKKQFIAFITTYLLSLLEKVDNVTSNGVILRIKISVVLVEPLIYVYVFINMAHILIASHWLGYNFWIYD